MYIGMDYNQILIGVIATLSLWFLMVAMNFIAFQNSSGNRAFTILRTIQRETVIHIFYRSVQFLTPHELMQHMHIQAKVLMDFRSALWRIGIDTSLFPSWRMCLYKAYGYNGRSSKESHLPAAPIFALYGLILYLTFPFQAISEATSPNNAYLF